MPKDNTKKNKDKCCTDKTVSLKITALTEIFAECLTNKEISDLLAVLSLIQSVLGVILIQREDCEEGDTPPTPPSLL